MARLDLRQPERRRTPPSRSSSPPFRSRLEGVDLGRVHHVVTIDFGEAAANWKLIVENFIEPYHVQFVHSATTEQPLVDHYTVNDPGCLGCAVDVSGDATREDTLSADSRYLTLFPNFVFGLYLPDEVGVQLTVPLAPDRTLQRRAVYRLGPESGPESAARKEELVNLWRKVHAEDHAMLERLQQGRASAVAAGGGVLSPVWEDAVRAFQERVVSALR